MKRIFPLISLLAFLAPVAQAAPAAFTPETKGDRIVLLGGSLIHGMESLINPSSSIKQGCEAVLVATKDQSLVAGLLQRKTGDSVLLRDTTGKVTAIPNRNFAKIDVSPVSLMWARGPTGRFR